MSEKLNQVETFEQSTDKIENAHNLIEAQVENHATAAAESAITPAEALKHVVEVGEGSNDQKVLEQLHAADETAPDVPSAVTIDPKVRATMAKREIKHLQQQENWRERNLSRVIHQPVVRAVSEGAAKTVTRPSGMLGGGLVAFLGSGSYLILAKYLHFSYNYSISLALFVGGFGFGLLLELFVYMATASRRQVD
jgi:hypothetical protein